ncbi:hypothetical protein H5410_020786, partial [Solanum commersonii]
MVMNIDNNTPAVNFTVQTENANGADWREELYQKSLPNERIEILKMFKMTLEHIMIFLWLNKHDINLVHKEKLFSVEGHIRLTSSTFHPYKS